LIEREGVDVQFRAKWLDAEVAVKLFIPGASRSSFAEEVTTWRYLAYLHERKMVYGDLRGSNIMIGSDGLTKLAEFSLSGSTRTSGLAVSTEGGVFVSTRWQSPERLEGEEATCASDVYSLGLCIVEVVSGEIPWKDKSHVMLWKKD
jgi:serine/threonine protein kinase